ncbi:hypothetical protein JB92DRAFT_1671921 [Gautieria morchelliformis]|nr:hypothetical protein JB92DRAFT_1671921 [Gautieria morchelliformis]
MLCEAIIPILQRKELIQEPRIRPIVRPLELNAQVLSCFCLGFPGCIWSRTCGGKIRAKLRFICRLGSNMADRHSCSWAKYLVPISIPIPIVFNRVKRHLCLEVPQAFDS